MLTIVFVAVLAVCSAAPTPFDFKAHADQYFKAHPLIYSYYFADTDDCTKYYSAFRTPTGAAATPIECPKNTHWNDKINSCTAGPCPTKEQIAACKTSGDGAYISVADDCSAFHRCVDGEPAIKQCCPANTEFSTKETRCVESKTCTKSCEHEYIKPAATTTGPPPTSCTIGNYKYEAVDGDANKYKQTDLKKVEPVATLNCAADQSFNLVECGCINNNVVIIDPDVKAQCVILDFDKTFSTNKIWVGDEKSIIVNKEACFSGDGYLNVPYLNNVAYEKFQVSFKYTNKGKDAVLLTNGVGDKINKASFAVAIVGENIKVTLMTNKGTFTVEEKATAATVAISYDGKNLTLKIGDAEKKVSATGVIVRVNYDLIIGRGFTGCIDDLSYCPMM